MFRLSNLFHVNNICILHVNNIFICKINYIMYVSNSALLHEKALTVHLHQLSTFFFICVFVSARSHFQDENFDVQLYLPRKMNLRYFLEQSLLREYSTEYSFSALSLLDNHCNFNLHQVNTCMSVQYVLLQSPHFT